MIIENQHLLDYPRADIYVYDSTPVSDGWKLSLQSKTVDDSYFLYTKLRNLLSKLKCSYKVGSAIRMNHAHPEQSKKALTIYIPNNLNHLDVAEKVYNEIKDYKGWLDIKKPTSYEHYAGAVYFRNDRDKDGNYILAN